MVDVQLEVIDLSTGLTVGTFLLTICTPQAYELDVGSYQFKATYLLTGEVQTINVSIVEGINSALDFMFTPPTPSRSLTYNSTPIPVPATITSAFGTQVVPAGGSLTFTTGVSGDVSVSVPAKVDVTEIIDYVVYLKNGSVYIADGITGLDVAGPFIIAAGFEAAAKLLLSKGSTVGGNIAVRPATYQLGRKIGFVGLQNAYPGAWVMPDNIHWIFDAGAVLRVGNGMNANAITLMYSNGWRFDKIEIDGNMANQSGASNPSNPPLSGIVVYCGNDVIIDSPYVHDCYRDGVEVFDEADWTCDNFTMLNGKITRCGWNGITAGARHAKGNLLAHNEILHCGDVGISIYGSNVIARNNWVHDMDLDRRTVESHGGIFARWGIGTESGHDNTIEDNTLERCGAGVPLTTDLATPTVCNHTVQRNIIKNCQKGVATDRNCQGNKILKNEITDFNRLFYDWTTEGEAISLYSSANKVDGNKFILIDVIPANVYATVEVGIPTPTIPNDLNEIINNTFPISLPTAKKIINLGTNTVINGNINYP